jgi:hypothetical protein
LSWLTVSILLIVVFLGILFFFKRSKRTGVSSTDMATLYKNLLRKASGDREQVDRLIELERKRNPRASLVELMQSAIDRWEHHNR